MSVFRKQEKRNENDEFIFYNYVFFIILNVLAFNLTFQISLYIGSSYDNKFFLSMEKVNVNSENKREENANTEKDE